MISKHTTLVVTHAICNSNDIIMLLAVCLRFRVTPR